MAVPETWEELKTEVATWMIRDDLTDQIPNFIGYAENRFNREVLTQDRVETTTLTATTDSVALPADFWGVRTIYVDGANKYPLEALTGQRLRELYHTSHSDIPKNYAIEGGFLLLGPAPSSSTSIDLTYWETIPALGDAQATNWLLTAHPDLYLAASLMEAFTYTRDEQRAGLWDSRTAAKVEAINRAGRRYQYGGPLASRARIGDVVYRAPRFP